MKFYAQNKICNQLGIGYDNKVRKQTTIISSA